MAQREGLKAVAMFEAIAQGGIKALWIMATNPAVSLPRADEMRAVLANLDLLVISDNVRSTDTIGAGPHVLFPPPPGENSNNASRGKIFIQHP